MLDEIDPELVAELLKRGLLDAYLIRHHAPEVEAHVESAVSRLITKTARKLGYSARRVIESEAEDVNEIVSAQLVESAQRIVSPEPVRALLDQIIGKHRALPLIAAHRVLDQGRKARTRKRRLPLVALDDHDAPVPVDKPEPDVEDKQHPLLDHAPGAVAMLKRRGQRLTLQNVAKELGVSRQYLHRIRNS